MKSMSFSRATRGGVLVAASLALGACSGNGSGHLWTVDTGAPHQDATIPPPDGDPTAPTYCGRGADVPGVAPPAGFCLKYYAAVPEPRVIAFAPNGDLFVASPSRGTPGGASGGMGAILVLSDDDHDGLAETHMFLDNVEDVHGLALGGGFLYFTTQTSVWKTPYTDGLRAATGAPIDLKLPTAFGAGGRWTHGLAISQGGQLFASRGEYGQCASMQATRPTAGEISAVAADGSLTKVAWGFRNPMYLRCHFKDEVCAAMELGDDLHTGAREKMLVIKPNTNYGFPCCYTKGSPELTGQACDDIATEEASFELAKTPFGFDWEPGNWPAPYKDGLFVALHGSAYSSPAWEGASIVFAPTSPTTHVPVQSWQDFLKAFSSAGGWPLSRPADVKFAPDGRLFFADDHGGHVFWIAPTTLQAPK
jgi:glucose/arabinose dehydrogenase